MRPLATRKIMAVLGLAAAGAISAGEALPRAQATEEGARLLDAVRRRTQRSFYDRDGLAALWPDALVAEARARALAAADERAERAAINALLGRLGASHAELMPRDVYEEQYGGEPRDRDTLRFGLEIAARMLPTGAAAGADPGDGPAAAPAPAAAAGSNGDPAAPGHETRYFLAEVLPGGVAWKAGLRRGDEVVALAGAAPGTSPRAVLFGDRGVAAPPHLLVRGDDPVRLTVRTRAGATPVDVVLAPERWSRVRATRETAHVETRAGRRLAYVRLYHVLSPSAVTLLAESLEGPFADCEALVLDLRGWGGRVDVMQRLLAMLPGGRDQRFNKPVVALIDGRTRSAKEVLAYHLERRGARLVGARTAGAVLACRFFPIGDDHVLMLPIADVDRLSRGDRLEGNGVEPHTAVADDLPFAAGRDAVLEAGIAEALSLAAQTAEPRVEQPPPAPAEPAREPALF